MTQVSHQATLTRGRFHAFWQITFDPERWKNNVQTRFCCMMCWSTGGPERFGSSPEPQQPRSATEQFGAGAKLAKEKSSWHTKNTPTDRQIHTPDGLSTRASTAIHDDANSTKNPRLSANLLFTQLRDFHSFRSYDGRWLLKFDPFITRLIGILVSWKVIKLYRTGNFVSQRPFSQPEHHFLSASKA